jgi:hypothetical protein
MKQLDTEQFKYYCETASGHQEIYSNSPIITDFTSPDEAQIRIISANAKEIIRILTCGKLLDILCLILAVFGFLCGLGIILEAIDLVKNSNELSQVIPYIIPLIVFVLPTQWWLYSRFIKNENKILKRNLKNIDYKVSECIPIGYAYYGTIPSCTLETSGNSRLFVVVRDASEQIFVFEDNSTVLLGKLEQLNKAIFIQTTILDKSKVFLICYQGE